MNADELAARLDAKKSRNGWMAKCPAHEDNKPSLSISDGKNDEVLLHDFGGCVTSAIVAAMGLNMSDLFPANVINGKSLELARYRYEDENGNLLYEAVRREGKQFHLSPANGRKGPGAMRDVRLVPYRLPEVIAAVAKGEPVVITEGEKDADRVRREGVCATTNPMGAGKWSKVEQTARSVLEGAHVMIVADRDEPGRKHAAQVAASLKGVAGEVWTVEAKEGKDISDHFDAGHSLSDVTTVDLNGAASQLGNSIAEDELDTFKPIDLGPAWRGEKQPPASEVFKRSDGLALLPAGINYLFGDSGDGKSWVALFAAVEEIQQGHPVVWVSYEDTNETLIAERLRSLGVTSEQVGLFNFITPQPGMEQGAQRLAELASELDARLLVLDSVGESLAVDGINEDKDNEVGPWIRHTLRRIHDLCPSLAILPIDHSTKAKDSPLFPSGSKRKRAAATARMFLLKVGSQGFRRDDIGYVQLVVAKDRGGTFRRGEVAAEISLDARSLPYQSTVNPPREGAEMSTTGKKRTAQERVMQTLTLSTVGLTAEEVHRITNDEANRLPGEIALTLGTVRNALTKIAEARRVTQQLIPTGVANGHRAVYAIDAHKGAASEGIEAA